MTPRLTSTLLRTQSDARLLLLAREGHEPAFEAIVERYRKPLQRRCRRLVSDAGAEDVVQQTFVRAWSAIQGDREIPDLKAWLFCVAANATMDMMRKSGYAYSELSDSLMATSTADDEAERRAVMRQTLVGLAALPERQRLAIMAIAVEGRTQAEVAAELGVSEGAVSQLVHRARATLRAAATAITPLPLASWAGSWGASAGPAGERLAELGAGAGQMGLGAAVLNGSAIAVTVGALAAGSGALPLYQHRDAAAGDSAGGITQVAGLDTASRERAAGARLPVASAPAGSEPGAAVPGAGSTSSDAGGGASSPATGNGNLAETGSSAVGSSPSGLTLPSGAGDSGSSERRYCAEALSSSRVAAPGEVTTPSPRAEGDSSFHTTANVSAGAEPPDTTPAERPSSGAAGPVDNNSADTPKAATCQPAEYTQPSSQPSTQPAAKPTEPQSPAQPTGPQPAAQPAEPKSPGA